MDMPRYNYGNERRALSGYGYEKKFGFGGGAAAAGSGIWYPSYLGIDIFFTQLSDSVLGMTNGRRILLREDLEGNVKDFVLMHEEEHVKDMSADEITTDKRAFRRFLAKHKRIPESVAALLEKRWGAEAAALINSLFEIAHL